MHFFVKHKKQCMDFNDLLKRFCIMFFFKYLLCKMHKIHERRKQFFKL